MIRSQHATVDGRRLHYFESGAGWPVVLIHAFPLSAAMWRSQLERVPNGWRFIAPDLRGFGQSDAAPASTRTMDDYAADIAGLMDALEIERAVIGGLSMGGYVAFALFRRCPDRIVRLLLADTRPQADSPEGRQARRALSEALRSHGVSAVADQMIPKVLGETARRVNPDLTAHVRRLIEANDPSAIDGAIHALITRPDSTPDLERIRCPVLIVVGEEDVVTPVADSQALHAALDRSNLVVVPGAGHLSSLEEPEGFSRALTDFLRSNI